MITTKKGDQGQTSLYDGTRVDKDDLRIEVNGQLDELNGLLGMCKALSGAPEPYETLQRELMLLMAAVAGRHDGLATLQQAVSRMEAFIAEATRNIPFGFVLPGTSPLDAALHIARAKTRTCERRLVSLHCTAAQPSVLLVYLNRLSDYLFALTK